LSLPVVNVPSNICLGVIDVMDICSFIVASFPSVEEISLDALSTLEYSGRRFLHETRVAQVISFSKAWQGQKVGTPLLLSVDTPLTVLANVFSLGIHRIPVIDENNKIVNFVGQSDLIRFFSENIYLLEEREIGKKTLDQLGLGRCSVYFVRSDAMTLLILSAISSKKVSAMPVLDKNTGKLVATFSASDLRGLGPSDLINLLRPLIHFVSVSNKKSLYPLTCKPTDTLEYVILKLAATKVHRLWVVDDDHQLLGVVSLTDVMHLFLDIDPMQQEKYLGSPSPQPYRGLFVGGTPTGAVHL